MGDSHHRSADHNLPLRFKSNLLVQDESVRDQVSASAEQESISD